MKSFLLIPILIITTGVYGQSGEFLAIRKLNHLDSIVATTKSYLATHQKQTDEKNQVSCLLIEAFTAKGDFTSAVEVYQEALKNSKDSVQHAWLYRQMGLIHKLEERIDFAQQYFLMSLKLMQSAKDYRGIAWALSDLTEMYRKLYRHQDGNDSGFKAIYLVRHHHIKDQRLLARLYNRLAAIRTQEGRKNEADAYSHTALKYADSVNDLHLAATSYNELGFLHTHAPELQKGLSYYQKADSLWELCGRYQDAAWVKYNMIQSRLYALDISNRQAIPMLRSLLDQIYEKQVAIDRIPIYILIRNSYVYLKDYRLAYYYQDSLDQAYAERNKKSNFNNLQQLELKYKNEMLESEKDIAQERLQLSRKANDRQKIELIVAIGTAICLLILATGVTILNRRNRKQRNQLVHETKVKDSLIQEIHHRVKNNLQFVSSLMNMQRNASHDEKEIFALDDAARRIKSMALVHEMLYNNDDQQLISGKNYLEELVDTLKDMSSSKIQNVYFNLALENIEITVSQSIALGMICSELVSNALKHGFHSTEEPTINVELQKIESNQIIFLVSDNGSGMEKNASEGSHLGMRLIDIFSRQLNGRYEFSSQNGVTFTLIFDRIV